MGLEDQVALLAGMVVANEHRRHVAEAILERCGRFVRSVE